MKRIIENGKVVPILSIGCSSGTVYNVRAKDTPFGMYVVRNIPEDATVCFLDEDKECFVADEDRYLKKIPSAEKDFGHWHFPNGDQVWEP